MVARDIHDAARETSNGIPTILASTQTPLGHALGGGFVWGTAARQVPYTLGSGTIVRRRQWVNASLDLPLMTMLNHEQLGWYATIGKGQGQPRKPILGTVDLHDV